MGKMDYLDALKRAMLGLPPDVQAKTLAYYEQRFVDGVAAGRSEQDVGAGLDDPTRIAMTLRASAHLSALSTPAAPAAPAPTGAFVERKGPADVLRLAVSAIGLAIFNLFMIVPAIVAGALLFAVYVSAAAFYIGGVATTASGLAGTSDIVIDVPSRFIENGHGTRRQFHVDFTDHGINISPEPDGTDADTADDAGDHDAAEMAEAAQSAAADAERDANAAEASANASAERAADDGADPDAAGNATATSPRRGVHTLDDGSVRISTGMDAESRTGQTVFGIGMVLGGIALFLLALVVTRASLSGLRRYLQMNLALLRGNGH